MHPILSLSILLLASLSSWAQLRPTELRCEFRRDPIGIEARNPRLSWVLAPADPEARNLRQTAYQIVVATQPELLEPSRADLWDSGKVPSDGMAHIAYSGQSLRSNQRVWWAVRVWDQDGGSSAWSSSASWTMGVLSAGDWQAKWIAASTGGETSGPLPLFRRDYQFTQSVRRALVHISGLGFYELSIDGVKVGDLVLDPGWTDYRKRCLYSSYDITERFQGGSANNGRHTIGVMLGNGMFNVRGGRYVKFTGSFGPPQFVLQTYVEFTDGTSTNLVSDESWRSAPGPISFSCIYGGEDYDARRELTGWNRPGFAETGWASVRITAGPGGRLVAQAAPPLKVMERFGPIRISEPKPGIFVYDLGQNFSGWPFLEARGPNGVTIKLTPGELLDERGLVSQRSSGGPTWFSYTLKGGAETEVWHPRFSYTGFRYIQVEGARPADSNSSADHAAVIGLRGEFIHSSAARTSFFESSEKLLNRIDRLICAAIESNLQSVLTDCPHREKLGWLEVSHLLGPAILFNYDVLQLYAKICQDMADAQLPNGLVPDIAPEFTVFSGGFRDSPEWGSACVINPWLIFQRYGDRQPLIDQYDVMARYLAYLGSQTQENILSHGLGDWYDIGPKPPGESQLTSKGLTATAIYYQDIEILRQVAEMLGKKADAEKWTTLGTAVRRAFNSKFLDSVVGQYDRGSQTAAAMPLVVGLVEKDQTAAVLANLVRDVRARTNQVTAGDVGFRYLVEALRIGGHSVVLYVLVTRREGPG